MAALSRHARRVRARSWPRPITSAPRDWTDPAFAGDDLPVVGVSWHDAQAYCAWRAAQRQRRAPPDRSGVGTRRARRRRGRGVPVGRRNPVVDSRRRAADRCRRRGRSRSAIRIAFGLYGIAANVHEWCADWHDRGYYAVSPAINPRGPVSGVRRASRGGSWRHCVTISRCAARSKIDPAFRYTDYGFRTARSV